MLEAMRKQKQAPRMRDRFDLVFPKDARQDNHDPAEETFWLILVQQQLSRKRFEFIFRRRVAAIKRRCNFATAVPQVFTQRLTVRHIL